jgi:hypothetical protein
LKDSLTDDAVLKFGLGYKNNKKNYKTSKKDSNRGGVNTWSLYTFFISFVKVLSRK